MNVGLVGHVDHGKTTLTECLTGKWTDTHSEELKKGITIRLGYADVVFSKCSNGKKDDVFVAGKCSDGLKVVDSRRISFVDAPGHESLMSKMLSGAALMDYALLIIASNEDCPQPQTKEHLVALEVIGVEKVVVVQNKVDLVSKKKALENYRQIKEFLKGSRYEDSPVIPVSAIKNLNVDSLIGKVLDYFEVPKRDEKGNPLMFVARSFDINKPGVSVDKVSGGVLGGVVKKGVFSVGDEVELNPGRMVSEGNKTSYVPLKTFITGIKAGDSVVDSVGVGGSVALMTGLDPFIVKSDKLTGSIVSFVGKAPKTFNSLLLDVHFIERLVGDGEVGGPVKKGETFLINSNSATTVGIVSNVSKKGVECSLKLPISSDVGNKVTLSRRVGTRFRLFGYGIIKE